MRPGTALGGAGASARLSTIATLESSSRARTAAYTGVFAMAVLAATAAFFGRQAGPNVAALLPVLTGSVIVTELMSAYVLFSQFRESRLAWLAPLGAAYLLPALIAVPYLAAFPGVFTADPALTGNGQSSVYLWLIWHVSFPALVLYAVVGRGLPNGVAVSREAVTPVTLAIVATCLIVAVAASIVLALFRAHLPVLVDHGHFTAATTFVVLPLGVLLDAVTVAVLYRKAGTRTTTSLWLLVAVIASCLDVVMGLSGDRYSYGWYTGKFFMMTSSTVMLGAFLAEISRMQRRLATANDDLMRSQAALSRFRLLSEITQDIILFVDHATDTILEANVAACHAYGYAHAELVGMPVEQLTAGRPEERSPLSDDQLAQGVVLARVHRRRDGSTFPTEVVARLSEIDGRRVIFATLRDTTEREQAREALSRALDAAVDASRAKSEFVATMSHEIRTPMNGVISMAELLLRTPLADDQREYATTVKESAEALLTVVSDILDFSKMEAGRVDLESVTFDPAAIVAGSIQLLRSTADAKGISLATKLSPRLPRAVRGDPTRLRQIILNLVGNAVKFTEHGGVCVEAGLAEDDGDGVTLRFAVVDTGIGISDETREHLFQPFTQADGTITRRYGGTGLGLTISRRLVELMGGTIGARSNPEGGSTFFFTARFERDDDVVVPAPAILPVNALRALIVDDNATSRQTLERNMSSWGIATASAEDGAQGLAMLADAASAGRPFDLVVIDYVLPQRDGIALGIEIRSDARFGRPALLMITAFDARGRKLAALDAGFVVYLTKPVAPSELHDAVQLAATARFSGNGVPIPLSEATDPPRSSRILLAEDQAVNRRVVELQLAELGYAVESVTNGREAIDAVLRKNYDLVLMDMHMPEVDGLTVARAIRKAEVETGGHVTIVALTANALERDRRACLEAGMDDYLAKPLQIDSLRKVLERWIPMKETISQ